MLRHGVRIRGLPKGQLGQRFDALRIGLCQSLLNGGLFKSLKSVGGWVGGGGSFGICQTKVRRVQQGDDFATVLARPERTVRLVPAIFLWIPVLFLCPSSFFDYVFSVLNGM